MPKPSFFSFPRGQLFWLVLFGLLVGLRLVVVAFSPLSLGGDEAQYWQWSTTPDWGYFSKPPLIAWLIASTTAIFGDSTFGVRVALPFLHGIAAWFVWLTARHLWPENRITAIWAAAIYLLMPGVFLSSFLMTTDALLLPLAAIAIYSFARANTAKDPLVWLVLLAIVLGLGLLAKYAMVFLIVGFAVLAAIDKNIRRLFLKKRHLIVFIIPLLIIAPNILWNQVNSFATFSHTAANIELQPQFSLASVWPQITELVTFWIDQLAVFGPISLFILLAALWSGMRAELKYPVFYLTVLCLAVFGIISIQALLSRAHANWAVIAYVPGSLVLAHFASNGIRKKILVISLALQLFIGGTGMLVFVFPQKFMDSAAGSALRPLMGWEDTADKIINEFQDAKGSEAFVAIVTDTRLFHYSLAWQLRDVPHPPLRMWSRYAEPHSHRELMQPLVRMQGTVLLVISRPRFQPRVLADFEESTHIKTIQIDLGGGRSRKVELFMARGFAAQKRGSDYEAYWQYLDD